MLELATSPTTTTITVTGDLDLAERSSFPDITARVSALRRQLVVLDLCAMTFLDSSGAAFLVALADSARRHGGVAVLRGASERDLFVLQICGALPLFRIDADHVPCAPAPGPRPWGSTQEGSAPV